MGLRSVAKKIAKDRVTALNVNVPGSQRSVDAHRYTIMREALLRLLPSTPPGLTQTEIRQRIGSLVPRALFPGTKADWWSKLVQLDLEARRLVRREQTTPLRWHRRGGAA